MNLLRWVRAAAALFLVACAAPPPVDPECYANRSWFPPRATEGVWDDCVRHFGPDWCHKCLWQ